MMTPIAPRGKEMPRGITPDDTEQRIGETRFVAGRENRRRMV